MFLKWSNDPDWPKAKDVHQEGIDRNCFGIHTHYFDLPQHSFCYPGDSLHIWLCSDIFEFALVKLKKKKKKPSHSGLHYSHWTSGSIFQKVGCVEEIEAWRLQLQSF